MTGTHLLIMLPSPKRRSDDTGAARHIDPMETAPAAFSSAVAGAPHRPGGNNAPAGFLEFRRPRRHARASWSLGRCGFRSSSAQRHHLVGPALDRREHVGAP
jgi:hypothetical protein